MNIINKLIKTVGIGVSSFAIMTTSSIATQAVCPICIVGVGAGLGLAQYLHIDDSITGVWLGGMVVALMLWTVEIMERKNLRFKLRDFCISLAYLLLLFLPLFQGGMINNQPSHSLWGIDKLILGPVLGMSTFYAGVRINNVFKIRNGGVARIPFQKVVFPISALLIATLFLYIIVYYVV